MNIILFYVCLFLCYVKKEKANKQKTVKKTKTKKPQINTSLVQWAVTQRADWMSTTDRQCLECVYTRYC